MVEKWVDIKGYEGYYQVSNYGRIKSLARPIYKVKDGSFHRYKKETIKSLKEDKDGYYKITLSVNGCDKTYAVHRLVAEAFVYCDGDINNMEVNHKDLNKKNNFYTNLEWVSHIDNVQYSSNIGRYKCHSGSNNGRHKPILVYDTYVNNSIVFEYSLQCAEWMIENNYCNGSKPKSVIDGIRKSIKNNKLYYNRFKFRYI